MNPTATQKPGAVELASGAARRESPDEPTTFQRVLDGRFGLISLFGTRFGVQSWRALDLERRELVVVKCHAAERMAPAVQLRLESEAAILQNLGCKFLCAPSAVRRSGDDYYMATPLLAGVVSLASRLRSEQGTRPVVEVLGLASCVLQALQAAHQQEVLHRDVKPANILVPRQGPLTPAILTNFGFAHLGQLETAEPAHAMEAAQYMSPEQAGLLDCAVGAPSDLYSLGVVLFECLAGRPPFTGAAMGSILRQHITTPAPELRSLGVPVPQVLDEIIQRLLRKDPRDRYQSAEAVLHDINATLLALERGRGDPEFVVGLFDRRHTLTEPAFVGRERELELLDEQFESTRQGQGGLVWVESESGGGKSRLLMEMALRFASRNAWVLQARAGERSTPVFQSLAEQILARRREEPAFFELFRGRLGMHAETVIAMLPEFHEALGGRGMEEIGPASFVETRALDALTALLDALGTAEQPAVVVFDDYQWADERAQRVVARWQQHLSGRHGSRHVLLVISFRTEKVGEEEYALRKVEPALHVKLTQLDKRSIERLVRSMAGRIPNEVLQSIVEFSDGSPFIATAALRGMVEAGALQPGGDGWIIDRVAFNTVRASRHAAGLLAQRVNLLPQISTDLLTAGAVLGKEFSVEWAAELIGMNSRVAPLAISHAQRRHMVWTPPGETKCVFAHDIIRETFLARTSDEFRRELHYQAAQNLEAADPTRVSDLAYYFDAAGRSDEAFKYAFAAAEQARTRHDLEAAQRLYEIAVRGIKPEPTSPSSESSGQSDLLARFKISEGLGEVLMLRGKYDDALQIYQAARFLAEKTELDKADSEKIKPAVTQLTPEELKAFQARIYVKIGELAFKRGDMENAKSSLEAALELLGRRVPNRPWKFQIALLREALVQTLHSLLPTWFIGRKTLSAEKSELLEARIYSQLGHVYWFVLGRFPTLWAHLHNLNSLERFPPTAELGFVYAQHGPAMSLVPWFSRALRYLKKSVRIHEKLGDTWGLGTTWAYSSFVLYSAARYEECIEASRKAIALLMRAGDYWQINMTRYQLAASQFRLGQLPEAVDEAKSVYGYASKELKDVQASGIILDIWAMASGGDVPDAILAEEKAHSRIDVQATVQVMQAEGVRLLSQGNFADARRVFAEARDKAAKKGIRNAWVAPAHIWLVTALREEAVRTEEISPARRRELLKQAKVALRRGLSLAKKFPAELPRALREQAILAAIDGRLAKAERLFERSFRVAQSQQAKYEMALTQVASGEYLHELPQQSAMRDLAVHREQLREFESRFTTAKPATTPKSTTLSLVDRVKTLPRSGRQIGVAKDREVIYAAAHDAVVDLLRAERCVVVEVVHTNTAADPAPAATLPSQFRPVYSRGSLEFHLPTVRRAIEAAAASKAAEQITESGDRRRGLAGAICLIATEECEESSRDDATPSGQRAALCVPILQDDRVVACLYAVHRLPGVFGEDEEGIGILIATIAGVALSNAQAFAKLEQLTATLEQKVKDRTAEVEERSQELARSNADLDSYAYVVSHDLQAPLRHVTTYCKRLRDDLGENLPESAAKHMQTIMDAAERMQNLIRDLLTFSRVGAGGIKPVPVESRTLYQRAIDNLAAVIADRNAQVTCDPLPQITADGTLLAQVFQNLIGNAIKFCRDRPPAVHVGCKRADGKWLFSIADNGIGIKSEDIEQLFRLFSRVNTGEKFEGTGIGLAICKKTVERHGGRIWVESTVGQGSTFWFTIPASEPDSERFPRCLL